MDQTVAQIMTSGSILQLSGLLGLALFFVVIGWREVRDENAFGVFFLALAIFFLAGHIIQLTCYPKTGPLAAAISSLDGWSWLASFLAPALVGLFLIRGIGGMLGDDIRVGLVKLFFGLTLVCYLYMLGESWPVDVRAVIAILWLVAFLKMEVGGVRT
jgi:hypothetical protein